MGKQLFWLGLEHKRFEPPQNQLSIESGYTDSQTGTTATVHNLVGVPAGALLVLMTGNENSSGTASISSSPSLTWTKRSDAATPNSEIWTAVFTAGGSIDVTSDWGAFRQASTIYVVVGQEATLTGAAANSVASQDEPLVPISTTRANSLIFVNTTNWNSITGARTYRGVPTETFFSAHVGTATFVHYTYTAPSTQNYDVGFTEPHDDDEGSGTSVLEIRGLVESIPDSTPPTAPVLSSPSHGVTTVALTWTASTDNVGVQGYRVYRDGTLVTTTTNLSYNVTGLTATTLYQFKVVAFDLANNETESNTLNVTTNTPSGGGVIDSDTFNFTARTDDFGRPFGGSEMWNKQNSSAEIVELVPTPLGYYRRYTWKDLMNDDGSFNWTKFDNEMHAAITAGQKFSFGLITMYPYHSDNPHNASSFYGDAFSAYPLFLHTQMQSESVKDWIATKNGTNDWVPNYNSSFYLNGLRALYAGVYNRIQTQSFTPTSGRFNGISVPYWKAMGYIDIRGHGSWGEWHSGSIVDYAWDDDEQQDVDGDMTYGDYPAGTKATIATMKEIIDIHFEEFPTIQLVTIINIFDHNLFRNTRIDNEVGVYVLNQSNAAGRCGLRRDQWGDNKDYYKLLQEENDEEFEPGRTMAEEIGDRWKEAPFVGEPPGYKDDDTQDGGVHMGYLFDQVEFYHAAMIGNGNYSSSLNMADSSNATACTAMRNSFKRMGTRLELDSGTMDLGGGDLVIGLDWQDMGTAPTYEDWEVTFELRTAAGAVVWSDVSFFNPHGFLPSGGSFATKTDTFADPGLAVGTYNLFVKLVDPNGYREPYPLNITGRQSDGSYFLCPVTYPS